MRAVISGIETFLRDCRGAVAIEFAFVFPVLLVISLGALDASLLMYEMHNGTEAVRRGAREAVVQQNTLIAEADIISATITCTSNGSSVSCTGGSVESDAQSIFDDILAVMQSMLPELTAADVTVTYGDSGISNGGVVTPTVTVSIANAGYDLIVGHLWLIDAGFVPLPSFRTTRVMNPTF